jgi:hypothetical protein
MLIGLVFSVSYLIAVFQLSTQTVLLKTIVELNLLVYEIAINNSFACKNQ